MLMDMAGVDSWNSRIAGAAALLLCAGTTLGQATTNPAPPTTPTTPAAHPAAPASGAIAAKPARPAGNPKAGWWNDRVFYEIFVRSFKDSSEGALANDGVGDLRGIIEKLDYLNDARPETGTDLEVGGLWLMPIHPSPTYHGYDISNYYDIAKQYGTLDEFRELVTKCHERDIKIVLDMVLNHSSNQISWFQEALDPKSPKHDWYIWQESNPGWKGAWNQKVWHSAAMGRLQPREKGPSEQPGPFYFGMFSHTMPDLNFRNPDVSAQMFDVAKFWLTRYDVDGYRLDAIRHLIESGQVQENTTETYEWLRGFQAYLKSVKPDCMSVGEVWSPTKITSSYVPSQMDLTFEFDLAEAMTKASDLGDKAPLEKAMGEIISAYPPNQYATFLSNHDQTRIATRLKGEPGKLRVAAQLLLTLPGVPFIYYGEEIGMTGDKPDENIRTPMQWTGESVAGFSLADAWAKPNADYTTINVAEMSKDVRSLLGVYKRFINLRTDHPALAYGDYVPVQSDVPEVFAFLRHAEDIRHFPNRPDAQTPGTQTALVVINLSVKPIEAYGLSVSTSPLRGKVLTTDYGRKALTTNPKLDEQGGFSNYRPVRRLAPQAAYVITLDPAASGMPMPSPIRGTR